MELDIQADEHYDAIDGLTDSVIAYMKECIEIRGGDGEEFIKWLSRGEVIGEIFEAIFAAMPSDYGVETKET